MTQKELNKISSHFESIIKSAAEEAVATTTLTKEQRQLATDTLTNMRRNILNMMDKRPPQDIAQALSVLNEDLGKVFGVFIIKKPI